MSRATNRKLNDEEIETSIQNGELSLRLYLWLSPDILDKESLNDYYDDYFTVSGEGAEATAKLRGDIAIPDEIHVPSSINGKVIFRVDFSEYINNNKDNLNLKILVDYSSSVAAENGKFKDLSSLEKYIGKIKENEDGIGESAFEGLKNLKEVQLMIYSNINISNNAFKDCGSLQKLEFIGIGGSITDIRESAFENCTSLQSIVFPKEKTNQGGMPGGEMPEGEMPEGEMPEGGMPGGQQARLEITITGDIYTNAFKGCKNISSLTINSCNTIAERAFEGCEQLKEIKINNTNYVGEGVFKGCIIDTVIPQEEADKQDPTQMKVKEPTIQFTNVKQIGSVFFESYKELLLNDEDIRKADMLSCILDETISIYNEKSEKSEKNLLVSISTDMLLDNQLNFKWTGE